MPIRIFYAQPLCPQIFFYLPPCKINHGVNKLLHGHVLSLSQCTEMDLNKESNHIIYLETDAQNLQLTNGRLANIYCHLFGTYMNIFYKTEVQMVILSCLTSLYPNWFKSYDTKRQNPKTPNMQNCQNW